MSNSRTKNSLLSMVAASAYYILTILMGLGNRKILIATLGIDYLGINGLFGSVLSVLSVAELGIGTAIIYHLYKPLANNDKESIKSIMHFYRKAYIAIALSMTVIGSLISLNLKFFVGSSSIPIDLTLVYFLMLADVVATYTFAYKRSILYADQKNYIISLINTIFVIAYNVVQILILLYTKNYYYFLASKLIFRIIQNVAINVIVNRLFPYLKSKSIGPILKEILNDIKLKIKGIVFHRISSFVVTGTDNIIISKFLGVATVGIYSNYFFVINSINSILQQSFDGVIGSVGNLIVTNDKKKAMMVFKELNLINAFISSLLINCMIVLVNPFISIVFGDEFLIPSNIVVILALNMIITNQRRVWGMFKAAAGIQYEDRFVPVVEAIINLTASLILVQYMGLVGVFLGTLISQMCNYFYTFPRFVFNLTLGGKYREYSSYLFKILTYQIGSGFLCATMLYTSINSLWYYALYIFIAITISVIGFILSFHKNTAYASVKERILELKFQIAK